MFARCAGGSVGYFFGFIVWACGLDWFGHARKNKPMPEDITVDQDKFDAVLKRMLNAKPISKAEISAKIKAERAAKKAAKSKT
jgi:hypothetical protein